MSIGVRVQILRVCVLWRHAIRADKPPNRRVVITRMIMRQPPRAGRLPSEEARQAMRILCIESSYETDSRHLTQAEWRD